MFLGKVYLFKTILIGHDPLIQECFSQQLFLEDLTTIQETLIINKIQSYFFLAGDWPDQLYNQYHLEGWMLVTNHIPVMTMTIQQFISLYIHIQVSPPTLEISCPVPPWPMPELQNCRNIAYYFARCGKRIAGNLESGLAFSKSHNFRRAFIIYDEFKRTSVQFPKETQCLNAHL